MNGNELLNRLHFYYCIIIAVRIYERQVLITTPAQTSRFLLKWLHNAQCNKNFSADLSGELIWLRNKIVREGVKVDYLPVLNNIYQQGRMLFLSAPEGLTRSEQITE
ncbi:hypothetical protein [Erwinia sp. E_sp_B04_7]|uniref:hypothetical protein n=1 Tax=unclassified Erwinia TaxID=2622719 RepID=UPI0030CA673C